MLSPELPMLHLAKTACAPSCASCRYWAEEPIDGEDIGVCTKFSVPARDRYFWSYHNEVCCNHEPVGMNG